MLLPARLRETTLGDVLASLHRTYASGVLELVEADRRHAIHLRRGLVQAVECSERAHRFGDLAADTGLCPRAEVERASREARARGWRIGHHLVTTGSLSPQSRDRVLDAQRARRLDALYALGDAELRFHTARPLPPGSSEQDPMNARETFHGRVRRRDRGGSVAPRPGARLAALGALGLTGDATDDEIRARYRARVRALHPDHAPASTERERQHQVVELRAVIEAYRVLIRQS
jgi:DnaJ domain